ncbi:NADH-quinone oxidoreductase subunit NuoK [Mesoterricola silvestris]|uniref:NADH-quinone oxidoreductase subunit K n=1 Tax=Mesoterricola silvestris TaxID=2927979 RepID=A0AA48HAL2_9BACT|nr:NADH-quinone oxidoreductase subunit NuoK [Mesoterricola silvestris]BDU74793.1 NADH-quinone oxidoreductase subunit K [Mesoterricola silvestris]
MSNLLQGSLQGYVLVALLLFAIGFFIVLSRRSVLVQFMGVELMLNAANVALLAFARARGGDVQGTVFYLFIIAVAACEAAVGLALVVGLFRHRTTTDTDRADALKL